MAVGIRPNRRRARLVAVATTVASVSLAVAPQVSAAPGDLVRLSVSGAGAPGEGEAGWAWEDMASISGDGRFVGFVSYATNLVTGDTNGRPDVFVHTMGDNVTERLSVSSSGRQAGVVPGPRLQGTS